MHLFRSAVSPLLLLAGVGLVVAGPAGPTPTTCAANNCYRAVKASAFTNRPTSQDCSNYFAPTPSPIPTYASNCQPAAYSSACSCIGVTAPPANPTFAIEATYASGANAGTSAGYVRLDFRGSFNQNYVYTALQAALSGAAGFQLPSASSALTVAAGDYAGRLIQAYTRQGGYMGILLNDAAQSGFSSVLCQREADNSLSCTHAGQPAVFGICSGETGSPEIIVSSAENLPGRCSTGTGTPLLTLKAVLV